MKAGFKTYAILLGVVFLIGSTFNSGAFALLGPVQPWMISSNNVVVNGDIGGPMDIGNGYRWNVPVLTYGFDQSFLDFFGSNGVTAVQGAIQVLNDLPAASQNALTNYPLNSTKYNYAANAQSLIDLKSQTLSLLIQHMGLAQPIRNMFVLKQWTPEFLAFPSQWCDGSQTNWAIPNYIVQRNFDPQTLLPSQNVNDVAYFGYVYSGLIGGYNNLTVSPEDPYAPSYSTVADLAINAGDFYTSLTYDDVGGLCYLLSTNNINFEQLLPGVIGVGTNSNSFVNGARRPGVDKIQFIAQLVNSQSGAFLPTTNYYTDKYITNGAVQTQQMRRIISQPDFLFTAADVSTDFPNSSFTFRSDTSIWINNAAANGTANGEGPGIIKSPIQINFSKQTSSFYSTGKTSDEQAFSYPQQFATFDDSTNSPIFYPQPQTETNQLTMRMWLEQGVYPNWSIHGFEWKPISLSGSTYVFQTSTNLATWVNLFYVTNDGSISTLLNQNPKSKNRFYRLIPQ